VTEFNQPHAIHAGFSNQGFLYNEAGRLTLIWSSFDPAYERLVGQVHPWMLDADQRARVEQALLPSPHGDRWLFANRPRCAACGGPIGKSILNDIYYLIYPGSINTDQREGPGTFDSQLRNRSG
jgi:hypothetical protein